MPAGENELSCLPSGFEDRRRERRDWWKTSRDIFAQAPGFAIIMSGLMGMAIPMASRGRTYRCFPG